MTLAICILAKDESQVIGQMLRQLARQSLLTAGGRDIVVHVAANGCTDSTVEVARLAAPLFDAPHLSLVVHDLHPGGKSRTWNRAVHDLIDVETGILVFLDADITFVDDDVLTRVVTVLEKDPKLAACSGYPVKDVASKGRKSALDRFSLAVSSRARSATVINGSLYAARGDAMREIWLPDHTPGEDGFLNAMVETHGFSREPDEDRITSVDEPTHYYEAHEARQFLAHERRIIVATIINRWIFERLWSLRLTEPAGPIIRTWNESEPEWVEHVIQERTFGRHWLVPNAILFGRFQREERTSLLDTVRYFPLAIIATVLTLRPAFAANRRLKELGSATTW